MKILLARQGQFKAIETACYVDLTSKIISGCPKSHCAMLWKTWKKTSLDCKHSQHKTISPVKRSNLELLRLWKKKLWIEIKSQQKYSREGIIQEDRPTFKLGINNLTNPTFICYQWKYKLSWKEIMKWKVSICNLDLYVVQYIQP